MNCEVLVISSSDSETDPNSDYELPKSEIFSKNHSFSVNIKSKTYNQVHDISGRSSDSELSLPDVPIHYVAPTVRTDYEETCSANRNEEQLWNCRNLQTNEVEYQKPSSSSQASSSQDSSSSSRSSTNVSVVLELRLCQEKFYEALQRTLDDAKISYTTEELPFEGMVIWKYAEHPAIVENQILLFLNSSKVTNMVSNFKNNSAEDTFLHTVQEIYQKYSNSKVTIVLFGMEKYFRSHKSNKVKQFRDAVYGDASSQVNRKRRNNNCLSNISPIDLEEAIVDLQLQANVNVRQVENGSDFSDIIISFTTSIREAPQKRLKQQHNFSWHVHGDSVGTVKVGKDMKGLSELWVQQIMQFHQVSKDTALAIASSYPSPQALLKAFQKSSSKTEASRLLENIEVRRGTSLLSTRKRIGPELSYKIHALFTTKDPDEIMHSARD